MAQTNGYCDPTFSSVREALEQQLKQETELGASICVNIDGKNLVDLWGGYADVARSRPWKEDTVTVVWSCSKVVTSLAVLILIDRGLLDPNEKVSTYWPEFGINGKENIKVSHILSHSSGLSGWEDPITVEGLYDLKTASQKLAEQVPWWTPGERSGYHLTTFGHMISEIVQRVSGKLLEQFIADEITGPLGADFQLGVVEEDWPRTADLMRPPPPAVDFNSLNLPSSVVKSFTNPYMTADLAMTPEFRRAKLSGSNGFSNARALARIGTLVSLQGTVDGKQYLSPQAVDRLLEEQVSGMDSTLFGHYRFGLGVGLPVPQTLPWLPEGRLCFWGGLGGSIFIMDLDHRMTISYVMNKMESGTLGNERTAVYVQAIYEAVNALPRPLA